MRYIRRDFQIESAPDIPIEISDFKTQAVPLFIVHPRAEAGFVTAIGIPGEEFEKVGSVKTLRSAVTSSWLALSRGGNPDYSAAFAEVLKQAIRSSIDMTSG
jgi:hypothetical protein